MVRRIIILGAGVMQSPAIRAARELGFSPVALDGNPEAPFRGSADRFEVIDLKDKEGILHFARALAGEDAGLAGIMTAGTDFSASVAYAAEKLGLPGIPYETALDASDKARMRAVFERAGVPSPAFAVLDAVPRADFKLPFAFPVVVKPVDNMGARGCRRADTHAELCEAAASALRFSRAARVIVEEYMEGPEFSVDALVWRGEITICGLAIRHIFYPPYFIEMGHTMSAELSAKDEAEILSVFTAGIRALGIENGAAKGDIKLTERGAMIGEIAARLSGGYMSGWTYPYASGVEPARGAVLIATGSAPDELEPKRRWTSAERAVISIPGTVAAVHGVDEAAALPCVKDVFMRIKPGDAVNFPENNVSKCGNVISAAPQRSQAITAAESAVRTILIELAAPDPATEAFLAAPLSTSFPPPAFAAEYFDGAASATDYAGRTLDDSLAIVRRLSGCEPPLSNADFRRALLRGGYQGALYYLRKQTM